MIRAQAGELFPPLEPEPSTGELFPPPEPRELVELDVGLVGDPVAPGPAADPPGADPPGVDPPIVAPVNPADSAEPPLTVDEGVPPSPELLRFDAEPRVDPAPLVFNPPSGWPKNPFTVVLFSPTWMMRQSLLPVSGSMYCLRR